MAAVAITFARYFLDLAPLPISEGAIASAALLLLVGINCLGVRAGGTVQSGLMVLKILAIALLVVAGLAFASAHPELTSPASRPDTAAPGMLSAIGAAMTWSCSPMAAGRRQASWPRNARSAPRPGAGVALGRRRRRDPLHLGSVRLPLCPWPYRACPIDDSGGRLDANGTRRAGRHVDRAGHRYFCAGVLEPGHADRASVYFAMAEDGLFFRKVAEVNAATRVPMLAIALQGAAAIAIALSGTTARF